MQVGDWVHCVCGCGYTGKVVEEAKGEVAVKNYNECRVYPADKMVNGAWCQACAERPARVLLTMDDGINETPSRVVQCWRCFSSAHMASVMTGAIIVSVMPLTQDGQEGCNVETPYA